MAELDDILAAEAAKLAADPIFYPPHQQEARMRRDEARARSRSLTRAARAEQLAVALEQGDADLRRMLRFVHGPGDIVHLRGPEEGPDQLCAAGCGVWPCLTRLIVDGDEVAAGEVRAWIEEGSDA